MRIALVTHKVDFQDGQGRVNYEIAKAALDRGHSVTVIAEYCSSEIANHPRGRFICAREIPIPTQLLRNIYFAEKSARWLRQHRDEFDIIQANGFVTWEPADIVAVHFVHSAWLRNPFFPFHWSSFSPYAYYQRLITIINGHYEKKAFRSADKLIAVSRFTAGEVAEYGISQEKLVVVHNGVDIEEFHPGPAVRSEFGLSEEIPLALFVGDIKTTRKNLETVLKAMQSVPELHLVVAGKVEGSPYPAIAEELKVSDRVHFIGKTSKIASLMRSVDFFVFPSRYEAHPLVLLEAMASGLPVVVSGNFGAADYIHAGGRVFDDPNDASALATIMEELVRFPEKRKSMGVAAREQALNMQWSQTAAGYLDVYEELLEKRRQSASAGHLSMDDVANSQEKK
ncbi:glycosyltransferase family 4 protein [Granulicella mallensis]|uniref:Glycosyl transferase group 1 n=1 Tax=Granulicella mallensis (strain ATCC BAA-1857 / DSM 23137 / MP5ACTX8) TaxID=682795 RepID=G8P088_GRAMM|nr:glycosyltransferase family 4 protein [Granulicella mallensis]AEU36882.1 glycosyl transferase group 1 [Granulicella mallensis MP5ACTX8]